MPFYSVIRSISHNSRVEVSDSEEHGKKYCLMSSPINQVEGTYTSKAKAEYALERAKAHERSDGKGHNYNCDTTITHRIVEYFPSQQRPTNYMDGWRDNKKNEYPGDTFYDYNYSI